jgi:hypothetical protein
MVRRKIKMKKILHIPKTHIVFKLQAGKETLEDYAIFQLFLTLIHPHCDIFWLYIELLGIYFEFRIYDTRWEEDSENN